MAFSGAPWMNFANAEVARIANIAERRSLSTIGADDDGEYFFLAALGFIGALA